MIYKIINNPVYTNRWRVGIEIEPKYDLLKYFISNLTESDFSLFAECVKKETTFSKEQVAFIPFQEMDYEDKAEFQVTETEALIYFYDSQSNELVINVKELTELLTAYLKKVFEEYRSSAGFDAEKVYSAIQTFSEVQ